MKRLIKFRLPYLFAAAFLLLCIGISCSEDPTWTKPTPEQEEIIPAVFIEDLVMPDAEEIFIPEDPIKIMGTGFDKYDVFLFRSTSEDPAEETKYFQAEISEVAEDYVIITVPKTIDLRSYELILKRYNKQQVLGPMTIYKAHFPAIPDQAGMTVKGRVYCGKKAVADVVVSDGVIVTKTDKDGVYYLPSEKKMGYVFVSIPSGYNIESEAGYPAFPAMSQQLLNEDNEQHDFALTEIPGGNTNHVMMVFTDLHLASKTPNTAGKYADIDQYKNKFMPDITAEMAQYANVYALCLGDITWDAFWYKTMNQGPENMVEVRYQLPNYKDLMKNFPCPVFNVIGNHDNDPKVVGDYFTELPFKQHIAPTYYSFNIGDVHYIVLDNDQYDNYNGGSRIERIGLLGDSDPQKWQMAWVAEDLKYVDKSKKIVVAMHAPMTSAGLNPIVTLSGGNDLLGLLQGYQVEFLTGHTHNNHHAKIAEGVREHNVAAVCGTWWFNVKSANGGADYDLCKDGSPTGYGVFKFNGTAVQWYYKGIEVARNEQFAVYDMNFVKSDYKSAVGAKANEVLVNVWNWDEDWTVSVTENGQPLTATRVYRKDPTHYTWQKDVLEPAHAPGSPNSTYLTGYNAHMFSAIAQVPGSTIKVVVTDPFGGVYEKTIVREIPSNLPAQWVFTKGVNVDEFVVDNKMPSATGKGYISYISNCDPALDGTNKIARANTAGEPYITGGWPGDWWLFTIPEMTIKAGTVINAKFHARASGTGMKYWMLEYYDGGEWKPGAPLQTTTVGEGDQAQTFSYNYEMMNTDHCLIDRNMTFEHAINNGDILIRLRCMANWQASGKGALAAPNGGTHRISVQNNINPTISIVQ